jgi:lipoate-protein ligase A
LGKRTDGGIEMEHATVSLDLSNKLLEKVLEVREVNGCQNMAEAVRCCINVGHKEITRQKLLKKYLKICEKLEDVEGLKEETIIFLKGRASGMKESLFNRKKKKKEEEK